MVVLLFFLYGLNVATSTLAPYIELLDGNQIPTLALGTARGTAKPNDTIDMVRDAVFWAIKAGYRHIDTGAYYDDEQQVGQGIAEAIARGIVTRDQLFITTKLWNDKHPRNKVLPSLWESLSKLGLYYVDLYLMHFPIAIKSDGSADNIDYLETWQAMEEARDMGLTRSIGVSNFNATQIDRLIANCRYWPVVNEIEVNPTFTQESLVPYCQQYGIAIMAYSPFGFLVNRKDRDASPRLSEVPTLVAIAQKYGKSTGQIVLRYLIQRSLIPIPKATNHEHIIENINVFDFQLTPEEMASIGKLNKNDKVITFPEWKNYPNYPF